MEGNLKIAILDLNRGIGDAISTIPAIRAIRKKFKNAVITEIISAHLLELVSHCPHIDNVISYDREAGFAGLFKKMGLLFNLRKAKFDIVIFLKCVSGPRQKFSLFFRDNLFLYLTQAKIRVGFYTPGNGFLLTHKLRADKYSFENIIDSYLDLVNLIGARDSNESPELWLDSKAEQYIDNILGKLISGQNLLIGINPRAKEEIKLWGDDRFAMLADSLIEQYQSKVIFTAIERDFDIIKNKIIALMRNKPLPFINTDLNQLVALINRCDLFISLDSGPFHIASSLGIPAIGIFSGREDPRAWDTRVKRSIMIRKGPDCSPCYKKICRDKVCLDTISVKDVLEKVNNLLRDVRNKRDY